jgi:acetyltransferase-like isoleucine patch superfamily enzyme
MTTLTTLFFKIRRRNLALLGNWRRKWFLLEKKSLYPQRCHIDRTVQFGKHFEVIFDVSASSVRIGKNFQARDSCMIRCEGDGILVIGENVFFNNHCSINCMKGITIGDNNQFGENVSIYDHNHKYNDPSKLISGQGYSKEKISIGNNCWISSNVIILKGVSIGDNVVIGAGCIIHRSVPSHSLVINKQELEIRPIDFVPVNNPPR